MRNRLVKLVKERGFEAPDTTEVSVSLDGLLMSLILVLDFTDFGVVTSDLEVTLGVEVLIILDVEDPVVSAAEVPAVLDDEVPELFSVEPPEIIDVSVEDVSCVESVLPVPEITGVLVRVDGSNLSVQES